MKQDYTVVILLAIMTFALCYNLGRMGDAADEVRKLASAALLSGIMK